MKKRFGTLILILLGSLLLLSIVVVSSFIPYVIEELSYSIVKLERDVWQLSYDIESLIDASSEIDFDLFVSYRAGKLMDSIRSSIDIVHVSSPFRLIKDGYMGVVYYDGDVKRSVVYQGQEIRYLKFSPSNDKFGFYYNKPGQEDISGPDVELSIVDIETGVITKVYEGGFKTSSWEWLNNREIVVYYGCGTECMVAYIIDTVNEKQTAVLQYGVGYEWSPDKKLVLAHRYTVEYGINVGNKQGDIVFQLLRNPAPFTGNSDIKALWSPDSAKIALIIQEENEDTLEIIVFDVEQDFKQIFQKDLAGNMDDIGFSWQHKGKALFYKDLNGEQVIAF